MGMCVVFVWGIVVDGGVDVLLLSLYVKSASLFGVVCETTNYRITRKSDIFSALIKMISPQIKAPF